VPASLKERAAAAENPLSQAGPPPSIWLRLGYWICIVIAVAAVLRRVLVLITTPKSVPPQMADLDAVFASHATLTLAHILPALVFVVITPFFVFRTSAGTVWPERVLFPIGAVVGLTAYAMTTFHTVGGWLERSAVLFFNTLFLFSLYRAYRHWHRGELALKRRWMLRAITILLGIATTRPVMGVFFATSRLTHLTPDQFFGIAFWIGFSINTVAIELWLHARDRQSHSSLDTRP